MKPLSIIFVALASLLTSSAALAHQPSHYYRPRVSLGFSVSPVHYHHSHYRVAYYPYDYSWRYYPGLVIAPTVSYSVPVVSNTVYPVVYDQPTYIYNNNNNYQPINPPSNPRNDWLYCHQPDGFYPAIKSCPGGWQRVPAQPR